MRFSVFCHILCDINRLALSYTLYACDPNVAMVKNTVALTARQLCRSKEKCIERSCLPCFTVETISNRYGLSATGWLSFV